MNILNSLLPVATFIIGFALNWFIGRKEFYFRFYREKELQVLAELNKELRDLFINYELPDGFISGVFFEDMGKSYTDKKEAHLLGDAPIILSPKLSENFIATKYLNDPFMPDKIRDKIKQFTYFNKVEEDELRNKNYLILFDVNEDLEALKKADSCFYTKPGYKYINYYQDLRDLKLMTYKILNKSI